MKTPAARLAEAMQRHRQAEDAYADACRRAYPVNAEVSWMHGGHKQFGIIVRHSYGDRFLALNERTGREVWIDAYKIVEASKVAS